MKQVLASYLGTVVDLAVYCFFLVIMGSAGVGYLLVTLFSRVAERVRESNLIDVALSQFSMVSVSIVDFVRTIWRRKSH